MDALSQVTLKLDVETMKYILDGVTLETIGRADTHNPAVTEADEKKHKEVQEGAVQARATHTHVNLQVTDWVAAQQEDTILKTSIKWISTQKVQDLKYLFGDHANIEEGMAILQEWKRFMLHRGALYHYHTQAREPEEVMWFVVPMAY